MQVAGGIEDVPSVPVNLALVGAPAARSFNITWQMPAEHNQTTEQVPAEASNRISKVLPY